MGDVVKIKGRGSSSDVEVNGLDIGRAVGSYHLRQEAGHLPVLELELLVRPAFDGEARVEIPLQTRAALIALGWTAPDGSTERVTYDDKTLDKVRAGLKRSIMGLTEDSMIGIISNIQNEGILFREPA